MLLAASAVSGLQTTWPATNQNIDLVAHVSPLWCHENARKSQVNSKKYILLRSTYSPFTIRVHCKKNDCMLTYIEKTSVSWMIHNYYSSILYNSNKKPEQIRSTLSEVMIQKKKIGAIIPSQIPRTRSPSCSLLLRPSRYWSQQLPAAPPSHHLPAGSPSQFLRHGHTLLTSCRAWHGPAQSAHVPGRQPLWRGRCWSLRLPPSPAPISIRWGSARSGQLASEIVGEVSFYWVSKVRTLGGQYEEDMGKYRQFLSFSAFYLWMDCSTCTMYFVCNTHAHISTIIRCLFYVPQFTQWWHMIIKVKDPDYLSLEIKESSPLWVNSTNTVWCVQDNSYIP